MPDVTIYHNPRCSKSREALTLLRDRGVEPKIIEYLQTPPSPQELKSLLGKLGMMAVEIIRTKEPEYRELGLLNSRYTEDGLLKILSENPKLIERPIIVKGDKAVIGRPPENALTIL